MRLRDEIEAIVRREGVIARKQHPELVGAAERLLRTGALVPVLPGVYGAAGTTGGREVRLAALRCWAPDAVVTGATAGQLTFWPDVPGAEVECALPWEREPQPGFRFSRRRIAPELVLRCRGLQVTCPALTALDLAVELGGEPVDQVLRTRAATLEGLWSALARTSARPGNRDRRRLLVDSRDQPWSEAERLTHRLLRAARVTGWKANHPVTIEGQTYYLDIAFPGLRLVVEIDGRLHEDDEDLFESDRWRQNALVRQGWTVLHFTWRMLQDHPEHVVEAVRWEGPPETERQVTSRGPVRPRGLRWRFLSRGSYSTAAANCAS